MMLTMTSAGPGAVPAPDCHDDAARRRRLQWARERFGVRLSSLDSTGLDATRLAGNIENLVGSVDVPVGLAGPLLFRGEHARGWLCAPLATTEGALVASVSEKHVHLFFTRMFADNPVLRLFKDVRAPRRAYALFVADL
jgi:hypothetical protein